MRENPYTGKYDHLTCEGFGKGSSYLTIFAHGDKKKLHAYQSKQNQSVDLPPLVPEDEDLLSVLGTSSKGAAWSKFSLLRDPQVLRQGDDTRGVDPRPDQEG